MLRLLIADDHAIVRKGLKEVLRESFIVRPDPEAAEPPPANAEVAYVGEAADGEEVLAHVEASQWDVVILDITMPRLTGLQVLQQLRRSHPQLPVLILSMHSAPLYVVQSLKLGASGYLSKESAPEELVAAVRSVLSGQRYVSSALSAVLGGSLDLHNGQRPANGPKTESVPAASGSLPQARRA